MVGKEEIAAGFFSDIVGREEIAAGFFSDIVGGEEIVTGFFSDIVGREEIVAGFFSDIVGREENNTGFFSDIVGKLARQEGISENHPATLRKWLASGFYLQPASKHLTEASNAKKYHQHILRRKILYICDTKMQTNTNLS